MTFDTPAFAATMTPIQATIPDTESDVKDWLTMAQAAKKSGIPARTIRRWVEEGKISPKDAKRFGERVILIRPSAVDKLKRPPRGNPNFLKQKPSK